MTDKLIGLGIGILVLGAGLYYLAKEREDREFRKIYTAASIAGGVITAACAALLLI